MPIQPTLLWANSNISQPVSIQTEARTSNFVTESTTLLIVKYDNQLAERKTTRNKPESRMKHEEQAREYNETQGTSQIV